jgi:malonate-semialdehyde dehydrogenase (acetylating) / methylmalonate-semialdehyde dehydrogenase
MPVGLHSIPMTAIASPSIHNLIGGKWITSTSPAGIELCNPATGEPLGQSPAGFAAEVDAAVQAAHAAFSSWRAVPVADRIQYLFRLKALLEEHLEELARLITIENGKTLAESKG